MRKEMAKKLEEDIKGKVYHIERDGSVIIEQPVNAKIFKKRTIKPQVSVEKLDIPASTTGNDKSKSLGKGGKEEKRDKQKSRGAKRSSKKTKKKSRKGAAARQEEEAKFFTPSVGLDQDFSANGMVLMPGVVFVKEGTELKGPPRVEDPNRMSMETYEAMHKMLEAKAIERASPTTVPDEKSVDGSQVASPVGILDQDDAASDAGVDENDMNAPLPEVDVSATKVEKSSADPNIILTQDPSWGVPTNDARDTSAVLPQKPSSRLQAETLGKGITIKPRDRRFIETLPASRKTHRPPPAFRSPGAKSPVSSAAKPRRGNVRKKRSSIEVKSDGYKRLLDL